MTTDGWIIDFDGSKPCDSVMGTLLWRQGNRYIMDSHRMALWCWSKSETFGFSNLLHIDAHYDSCGIKYKKPDYSDIKVIPPSHKDYQDMKLADPGLGPIPQFRWDNFLSIYLKKFHKEGRVCYLTPESWGDKPPADLVEYWPLEQIDEHIASELKQGEQWIVDVDLDYFFDRIEDGYIEWPVERIASTARAVKAKYDDGIISILTIAISDNCCGGIVPAKRVLKIFCDEFGLEFPFERLATETVIK